VENDQQDLPPGMSILSWQEFRERSIWEHELRIDPAELKLGHFVRRLSIPWKATNFPLQGILVDTFEKKKWLQTHCEWVVIDLERSPNHYVPKSIRRGLTQDEQHNGDQAAHILRHARLDPKTLETASRIYRQLDQQTDVLINDLTNEGAINAEKAAGVVGEMADDLSKNLAALVWLSRIKQKDRYTAQHCINVAILSMGLAASMGWSRHEVEMAGLAGLLHDLGKMRLDLAILNKKGRLTAEEFEYVKQHTTFGYEMLKTDAPISEGVADAVLTHHERPDGKGYPQGLTADQISPLSKVISIVDAYDAITSNRVYDPARSHHEALGILWKNRGQQFDLHFVESMTRFMGWVTPGTLVRLSNDELAIVLESPSSRGFLPLVRMLVRERGQYRLGARLDLSALKHDDTAAPVRVARVLPDGHNDIDMRELTDQLAKAGD
jgi:putative nucleotidyltransferase with HDIG domain